MKKLLFILLMSLLMINSAHAGMKATSKTLTIGGSLVSAYAIGSGITVTSDAVYQSGNVGFSDLALNVSGNINVSTQVSKDGVTWWTPNVTDGTTLTSAGGVATAVTSDKWIVLTAKLAPYVRFVFASTGSSTITAAYLWQDQN